MAATRLRGVALGSAVAVLVLLAPQAVVAQGASIDLQQFRPAMDSKGYITVNSSMLLGNLDVSFGLVTSWAYRPLRFSSGTSYYHLDNLLTPQLQAAVGILGYGEVGIALPFSIIDGATNSATAGQKDALGWQNVGDVQLHLKGRVLQSWRHPVGLAGMLTITAPSGPGESWSGEKHAVLIPSVIVDRDLDRARRWRVGLNLGARIRTASGSFTDTGTGGRVGTSETLKVGSELLYGVGVSYVAAPQRVDLLGEIYGAVGKQGGQPSSRSAPAEAAAGVKVYLAANSFLLLGAGAGVNPRGYGTPLVRLFAAFIFEPRVGDRDGDGVPDDADQCPTEPGPRENMGCPDVDSDGDGIVDRLDKCPELPGPAASGGCPMDDRDGDGIPDRLDKCPDVAGTKENDGCPDPRRVIVRRGDLSVLDKVYFETNKAIIKPISFPILNAIAITLKGNPQILKVEIQGHADERGSNAHNDLLTSERAKAVLEYLVQQGIDRGRLQSHGYGKRKPLCPDHHETCWSKNRRVEFVIMSRSDGAP